MATSKAFKTKASSVRRKVYQSANVVGAISGNHILMDQAPKVIVLTVNPSLDKLSTEPLNHKAEAAKNMFAKSRKNH